MENKTKTLNFVSELNILNEDSIYQENGKLKIDKAIPYKNIRCDGHTIDNPDLTEKEIEHVEENNQEWIVATLIAKIASDKNALSALRAEKS
jgi:hypothetical protein